jgi:hypothetical protein
MPISKIYISVFMSLKRTIEKGTDGCSPHDENRKKKSRSDPNTPALASPKRRAFARECKFVSGEKVIGFYGGWPYPGLVSGIAKVDMSFGSTYLLNIRWNGFSGKNSNSWISEFDVVKHDEAGLQMKNEMEQSQRDLIRDAGKVDKVKQKKIFLQVVSRYRGKRLAPFAPHTAPFPDEWQTVIRVTALPKILTQHIKRCDDLIAERKLCLTSSDEMTVEEVLKTWASTDVARLQYAETIRQLFNKFFLRLLVHKFELPLVSTRVLGSEEFAKTFSVQFLLRLLVILPELLTAACVGVLRKGDGNESFNSFVDFLNSHQSFLAYLEENVETLLQAPIRKSTLDEPVHETEWVHLLLKDETLAEPDTAVPVVTPGQKKIQSGQGLMKSKRKRMSPKRKASVAIDAL